LLHCASIVFLIVAILFGVLVSLIPPWPAVYPSLKELKAKSLVPERSLSPITKVDGLAYVIFKRTALEGSRHFFPAFGLLLSSRTPDTLYMRTRGHVHHAVEVRKGDIDAFVGMG